MTQTLRPPARRASPRAARRARPSALLFAAFALLASGARPAAPGDGDPPPQNLAPATLDETRLTLGKWIETQQIISKERNDWQQGKEILVSRLDLAKKEVTTLQQQIVQAQVGATESAKKQAELVAQNDQLKAAGAQLGTVVTGMEADMAHLFPRLPEPIRTKLQPLYQRIPEDPAKSHASVAERFQNVLGILNELNKANGEITVSYEVHTLADGKPSEVQTIYVGLTQAYYVSSGGEAGIGRPTDTGWAWEPSKAVADDVLRALEILQGKQSPAFVPLPVRLKLNILRTTLCIASLAAGAFAQQSPDAASAGDATIGRLSQTAEKQLAASIDELNKLRAQTSAEKLPLAQDLTATEDQLVKLRRQHEDVTRAVDSGNLEIATIKAEMKARQDELDYVGNLLDEYARTFETTVNVCELQSCGEVLVAAKEAPENTSLSMTEKFERQTTFAGMSLKRISDCVGGLRFPGVGVDQQGTVQQGQFAIIGPVALFRANDGQAGLAVTQTGSDKPLIRPLEGPLGVGLGTLVESGEGVLPLDPSRGGALKALVAKTNLIHIFEKGGPIMWPLLCASILALGTVLERIVFLVNERRKRNPMALERMFEEVEKNDIDAALAVSAGSKDYVVRTLGYALKHRETSLPNALFHAQQQELRRFRRGIPILDTIMTLAPLLGLLGTVTGMMASFSLISGELSAPGAITGGIAEALIATAFGLGIAITSLIPFNFLNAKLDEARHEIESGATQLELLVQRQSGTIHLVPSHAPPPMPAPRRLVGKENVMHGGGGGGGVGKRARIEIIPLIDIIFFLLATFIMVSLSMTKNQGIQVPLPTASTAASLGDQREMEKAVTLSINEKGEVFYNKEKITITQLPMRLQALKSTSKDPKIIINGDANVDFKYVVGVLDEVRKIGITKVDMNTDKK